MQPEDTRTLATIAGIIRCLPPSERRAFMEGINAGLPAPFFDEEMIRVAESKGEASEGLVEAVTAEVEKWAATEGSNVP